MRIAFTVNDVPREVNSAPLRRLLDILRDDLGLTGTKEGCGEGECGACSVLLDGMLVQSCLIPAVQLPGRQAVTIEALGSEAASDPVQRAFLDEGAVQCGFCIPGMVLATHALLARDPQPDEEAIRAGLSGNICRCTGYERIVRAVQRAAEQRTSGSSGVEETIGMAPARGEGSGEAPGLGATRIPVDGYASATTPAATAATEATTASHRAVHDPIVHSPTTLERALAVLQTGMAGSTTGSTTGEINGSTAGGIILAGGTDLMLPGVQASLAPRFVLDLSRVDGLAGVRVREGAIEIGGTTTVSTLAGDPNVARCLPALAEAARLFGAPAIRNRATLGGNLAGASPAADLPPPLLALGAVVVLASASGVREVPLEAFATGYRQTVRRIDELIVAVRVPLPAPDTRQAFFKAGTRRAQSIARASVAAAARVDATGTLRAVRLAAGSVAPVPILLTETMRLLEGRRLDAALIDEADRLAASEVTPIEDVRSNIEYRRFVTGRLVARFLRECCRP
jgi:carbon-monoxide dehydrogenase small subunit/xanthine dehydrogenase small subunit